MNKYFLKEEQLLFERLNIYNFEWITPAILNRWQMATKQVFIVRTDLCYYIFLSDPHIRSQIGIIQT